MSFVPKPQTYKKPTTILFFGEEASGRVRTFASHVCLCACACACCLHVMPLVLMCWPNSPTTTSGAPQRSLIDRLLYDKFEEELIIQPGRYFPPDVRPSLTALLCAHGSVSLGLTAPHLPFQMCSIVQIKCCLVNETTLIPVRFVRPLMSH